MFNILKKSKTFLVVMFTSFILASSSFLGTEAYASENGSEVDINTVDLENISDEELNSILDEMTDEELLEFLFSLEDEQLEATLDRETLLKWPVYGATMEEEEGTDELVGNLEVTYNHYYECLISQYIQTYSWTNGNGYTGTASGECYLGVKKDGTEIDKYRIRMTNITSGEYTLNSSQVQVSLRSGSGDMTISTVKTDRELYPGPGETEWAGIRIIGSYTLPAHYRTMWYSDNDGTQGRYDPWNEKYNYYSLDTNHYTYDVRDSFDIQVNGLHWGGVSGYEGVADEAYILLVRLTNILSINPNGGVWNGTTSVSSVSKLCGDTYTVANPTREGYKFTGWTFSNGSGASGSFNSSNGVFTACNSGATFSTKTDVYEDEKVTSYLTANWIIDTYKLTLNNGTGISNVYGGGDYRPNTTVSIDATVKTGYHWDNWTGTYTYTNKSTSFAMPNNAVSLTANAIANNYTVKYLSNNPDTSDGFGVNGNTADSYHTYDAAKTLTKNGYTKEKWVFNGWNTKADGSGTSYSDKQSVINLTSADNGIVYLYAQWIPQYDLKVDPQAGAWRGSAGYQIFRITKGDSMTIENPIPTTTHKITLVRLGGYGEDTTNKQYEESYDILENFDRWKHTGGNTWDNTARKWTSTNRDATLTALYKPGTYTLVKPADRENFDFLGWSKTPVTIFETPGTNELESEVDYKIGDKVPVGSDITLYEVWRVHFDLSSDLVRVKKPNKNDETPSIPEFDAGEMGIIYVDTVGYVNKIEIKFPVKLSKYDDTLDSVHVINPKLTDSLSVDFNIPLYAEPGYYLVQITAYNEGGKALYSTSELIVLGETVLNQFKTTIR